MAIIEFMKFFVLFCLACFTAMAQPNIGVITGDKEWPNTTGLSEISLTNVDMSSKLAKDWSLMGWIQPGKPKERDVLIFNLELINWGDTDYQFSEYDHAGKVGFVIYKGQPMIKCFWEVTLADKKGYIVRERYGESVFDWHHGPYTAIKPGIMAHSAVMSPEDTWGSILDVTGVKDGDYELTIRLNPRCYEGQRWPPSIFREAGHSVPVTFKKGKAFRTDLLLVRKVRRPPATKPIPIWVRKAGLQRAASMPLPPMPPR